MKMLDVIKKYWGMLIRYREKRKITNKDCLIDTGIIIESKKLDMKIKFFIELRKENPLYNIDPEIILSAVDKNIDNPNINIAAFTIPLDETKDVETSINIALKETNSRYFYQENNNPN